MSCVRFELDPLTGRVLTAPMPARLGALPFSTLARVEEWRRLPAPPATIRLITHGLDPVLFLPLAARRHGEWRAPETPKLVAHLAKMLDEGVIEEVPKTWHGRVVENFFFGVPKPNGKIRPVLDCKATNSVFPKRHLKMEALHDAIAMLQPGDYMTRIDISSAFHHVRTAPRARRLFAFRCDGRLFWYIGCPMGFSGSSMAWRALMLPPVRALRRRGSRNSFYADEILLAASTRRECLRYTRMALDLFASLGLVVNLANSATEPSQTITYLGHFVNTRANVLTLTDRRRNDLRRAARRVLRDDRARTLTCRTLASLVGSVVAAATHFPRAWFHAHALMRCLKGALRAHNNVFSARAGLNERAREDARLWASALGSRRILHSPLWPDAPRLVQTSDASSTGWGGIVTLPDGTQLQTHGHFSPAESSQSSNRRELMGASFTFFSLTRPLVLPRDHLHFRVDNMTAHAYLRRFGGRVPDLNEISESLLRAIIALDLYTSVSYVASADNEADAPSRSRRRMYDFSLSDAAFARIVATFGRPTFDLFATRLSAKCPRFAAWRPDPAATTVDAFSFNWSTEPLPYAFPPPRLIARVLSHARTCRCRLLLVHPTWPGHMFAPVIRAAPSSGALQLSTDESTLTPGAGPRDTLLPGNAPVPLRVVLLDFTNTPSRSTPL